MFLNMREGDKKVGHSCYKSLVHINERIQEKNWENTYLKSVINMDKCMGFGLPIANDQSIKNEMRNSIINLHVKYNQQSPLLYATRGGSKVIGTIANRGGILSIKELIRSCYKGNNCSRCLIVNNIRRRGLLINQRNILNSMYNWSIHRYVIGWYELTTRGGNDCKKLGNYVIKAKSKYRLTVAKCRRSLNTNDGMSNMVMCKHRYTTLYINCYFTYYMYYNFLTKLTVEKCRRSLNTNDGVSKMVMCKHRHTTLETNNRSRRSLNISGDVTKLLMCKQVKPNIIYTGKKKHTASYRYG